MEYYIHRDISDLYLISTVLRQLADGSNGWSGRNAAAAKPPSTKLTFLSSTSTVPRSGPPRWAAQQFDPGCRRTGFVAADTGALAGAAITLASWRRQNAAIAQMTSAQKLIAEGLVFSSKAGNKPSKDG
jgi:hypothetical protein